MARCEVLDVDGPSYQEQVQVATAAIESNKAQVSVLKAELQKIEVRGG